MGTVLGKICPGQVNKGMRKTGGTVRSEWRTYHEFSRRRNLIGAAHGHFHELTDKAGRRMTPPPREKFEEGHDRTMELGISQEEKGSSPAQLCTSRLLQRRSMQNSHVVRGNVSPSSAQNG